MLTQHPAEARVFGGLKEGLGERWQGWSYPLVVGTEDSHRGSQGRKIFSRNESATKRCLRTWCLFPFRIILGELLPMLCTQG